MKKRVEKKFFVFDISPSEIVTLNSLYQERILAIGTQCVTKQFLDFPYH